MEEIREIAVRDESLPIEVSKEKTQLPVSTVQSRMEELIPFAGTIETTHGQRNILFAPVKDEDVEIRPDGLVYLPWPQYVERLRDAFGVGWAIIPKDMPKLQQNHMYWPFYLMIQGKLAGFAIGEQEYQPNNPQMSYSDASEGAKSNALMRLCKGIGISLELWKPSFIRAWKVRYAESFPAVWPDGNPKLDKNGKQKVEWKRKDREAQVVGEVLNGTDPKESVDQPPPASSLPIITSLIDSVTKRDRGTGKSPIYTLHIGDNKITTFSETFAKTAKEFVTKKESAQIEYKATKYGMELVSIIPVGTEEKK